MSIAAATVTVVCGLFWAADPTTGAGRAVAAVDVTADGLPQEALLAASVPQSGELSVPKRLAAWCDYVRDTGYRPGAIRNPNGSWFKHAYLVYRGNYYLGGYDYRSERDYPWGASEGGRSTWRQGRHCPAAVLEILPPPPPQSQPDAVSRSLSAPLP